MARAFEFRHDESLQDAFRRIADHQLTRAAEALTSADVPAEERIHEARKRFKESRALLRLYRPALGDAFAERNRWLRDLGRTLAPYRDATAVRAALNALPRSMRHDIGRWPMRKLRRLARERCDALYTNTDVLREVAEEIESERKRASDVPLTDVTAALRKGFERTLAAARKAMTAAFERGDDAAFHEWRKRVKDHWYHVQLFVPVWPELMQVREAALHDLSRLLGDYHDVALVRASVDEARFRRRSEADRIRSLLAQRQAEIAAQARPIAERLFGARPRDLARETLSLWHAWHGC